MIQGAMGYRAPGKALARCQWRGPKKLLYFSCFGLPKIHLHTAQVLVVNMQITVWKSLIGSQTKGAIIRDVRTDGQMDGCTYGEVQILMPTIF